MPDTTPPLLHFRWPDKPLGPAACGEQYGGRTSDPGHVTCFACRRTPVFLQEQHAPLPQRVAPAPLIHFTTPVLLKRGETACKQDHRTHQVSASPGDVTCFSCRKSAPFLTRQAGQREPYITAAEALGSEGVGTPTPLPQREMPKLLKDIVTQDPELAAMNAEAIRRGEPVPQYLHDCSDCEYLGSTLRNGANNTIKRVELYWCHAPEEGNVLARYSDSPGDYHSGLSAAQHDPDLALAVVRAIHKGLFAANALHFL